MPAAKKSGEPRKPTKENVNRLARMFYASRGHSVEEGYDFSAAHHPQEVEAWNMACASFKFIIGESPPLVDGEARLKEAFRKSSLFGEKK